MATQPVPVTPADMQREIGQKMGRVQRFLKQQSLGGVLLTKVNNFSWVTAGIADNHIVITSEVGAASLLIMNDGQKYVIASNSEMPRLMAEDLKGLGYEPREFKWYADKVTPDRKLEFIRHIAAGRMIGTDVPYDDLRLIDAEFQPLRYELTDSEVKKYRWLGRESTEAVVAVCRRLKPGMSERELEAMASDELMRRGIRPTVLLMGTDERVYKYRHTVPTDKKLERYAMVNVCARKWGLVISTCRFVHFGPVPDDLRKRVNASAEMTARYLAASSPGATAGDILNKAAKWYTELGFAGELELHHQGGAIGYAEREWIAVPGSTEVVHDRQALAWNPIIQGGLSFDTFVVYKDHVENVNETADWPTITVKVHGQPVRLPDILVR
jgi:antitoxin VapB